MSEHARIENGTVAAIVDIDPAVRAAWLAAGNPKASVYLPVSTEPVPAFDPKTQAAEPYFEVGSSAVDRKWAVRPLTADERRKTWTSFEFLNRFTPLERASIRTGSVSDAALADFLMMSQAAQEIVSDDPMTAAGMDYLVSLGILTPARRAEILP